MVKKLGLSFKEAQMAIQNGEVLVNKLVVLDNQMLGIYDSLQWKGKFIQDPNTFQYVAYYKPCGIECTLAETITDGLYHHLPPNLRGLFYAGRLDKQSEGLLLLTNDGHIYNHIIQPDKKIEKQYLVHLEKPIQEGFLTQMASGVEILGQRTNPCKIWQTGENSFEIILEQGLNRQIRRMCFALGNYVIKLKRTRIAHIHLGDLTEDSFRQLTHEEMTILRNL